MTRTLLSRTKTGVMTAMTLSLAMAAGSAQALTLYTAGPGSLAKKLAAGYEKQTGVKVDVFQATTGKVMARLEAEQANPRADVLISASWDTATDLEQRGWLLEYQSPNAAQVPAQFKTPYYVAQGISALGIVWNTKRGTSEPKDWGDLTKPEFKDKVTTPDPSLSGASLDLLIGLQNAHAQQAAPAFERGVAIHFDAAALPQKVNRKARQQIGFGAGEFGGISVDLRGMGADVGAALEHALRGLSLGRGGLLCQHVYAAFR